MDGRALLEAARAIARVAHAGQFRRGTGEDYFNHCDRVAGRVYGWKRKTVAYLHDTVEDTRITLATLRAIGFPEDVLAGVDALTRREGETYREFIRRCIETEELWILEVKLADLQENLDDIDELDPKEATGLRKRYGKAEVEITEAIEELAA